jgi:4'-phosphopantetheinyl transferase
VEDERLLASYLDLMSPEEHVRQRRYRFEKSRREFLLTRALVRTTLSRYAPVDPTAWTFRANAHGRPEIASPAQTPPLRFNLSNTEGMITCLVALDREIGCDVELVDRPGETVQIAEHFFSPLEVAALRTLPDAEQRDRFFDYWTLKESYIKARGMGLAIPLDQFSFLLDEGRPVRIAFDPRLPDDPSSWQFEQLRPSPRHFVAVAIRRGQEPDLALVVRHTVPLAGG